jgi:hypothetical protein
MVVFVVVYNIVYPVNPLNWNANNYNYLLPQAARGSK